MPKVDADWSVELGRDDDALELPWSSEDGLLSFCDLKKNPEALETIPEAVEFHEMHHFLATLNARASGVMTAKCDVWQESGPEVEATYGESCLCASYVDILFEDAQRRFSFEHHEGFARATAEALGEESVGTSAAEIIVRRCYYHEPVTREDAEITYSEDSRAGYYVTFYAFGLGTDEEHARRHWAHLLVVAAPILLRLSCENEKR